MQTLLSIQFFIHLECQSLKELCFLFCTVDPNNSLPGFPSKRDVRFTETGSAVSALKGFLHNVRQILSEEVGKDHANENIKGSFN